MALLRRVGLVLSLLQYVALNRLIIGEPTVRGTSGKGNGSK